MIGHKISPILEEIELALLEHEGPIEFTHEGFRAALKIFFDAMLDKMWALQTNEDIDQQDRELMAEKLGEELRAMVKTYTNIDTFDLYK